MPTERRCMLSVCIFLAAVVEVKAAPLNLDLWTENGMAHPLRSQSEIAFWVLTGRASTKSLRSPHLSGTELFEAWEDSTVLEGVPHWAAVPSATLCHVCIVQTSSLPPSVTCTSYRPPRCLPLSRVPRTYLLTASLTSSILQMASLCTGARPADPDSIVFTSMMRSTSASITPPNLRNLLLTRFAVSWM